MPFILGQRWISDTESELGLGTVTAVDHRMVTILFSASGENRIYAISSAPLTRVIFNLEDIINSHEGWQLKVEYITETDGLLTYIGSRLDTEESGIELHETLLDHRLTFSKPQDRLFAGQIDRNDRFVLRYQARQHLSEQFRLPESGLRGVRASLIPHQLHIAHEVGQRYAPRVLLADEVGLGKTIEAGMIVHQQLLAGRAERVLIVVPESLQHQWLVEMLRRFNLRFSLFDNERYIQAGLDDDNPFETEQLVLCSLDFVAHHPQHLAQLLDSHWDLLIVDEAHHLAWNEHSVSQGYLAIEQLAAQIPGVLLLTATPEQLGQQSHFARLRLLDPDRFHNYQAFLEEQQNYRPVADAVTLILRDQPLNQREANLLAELIDEQDIEPLIKSANSDTQDRAKARQELVEMLLDRHGTSRVLFRNTRQSVKGFPHRYLHQIKLPLPTEYQVAIQFADLTANEDPVQNAKKRLYPERLYQETKENDVDWWKIDPRINWLLDYLISHREQKNLVICNQKSTVLQLEAILREREGIRTAIFHEGLSLLERDRSAAYFSAQEEGAQVLICSEIGSEGRNFQFSHHLIMFDLPFNPDLLEQRIGRLDRIGQTQDVQIFVPYLANSAQAVLLSWYHDALNAFEQTCPSGRAVYDNVYQQLLALMLNPNQPAAIEAFIRDSQHQHHQFKHHMEAGRDRLLELNSNGGNKGPALANTLDAGDNDTNLIQFTLSLFDIIGINQEDRSSRLIAITPADNMLVPDFPGISQDGCLITFDREEALSREDAQFLTWEHPIIRNGLDLVVSGDMGNCAVSILKNPALPVGTLLVELIYVVETQAPQHLHLTRFLPPTPVRILLDPKGENLANNVGFDSLNRQLHPVKRQTASKLANAVKAELQTLLQAGEKVIAQQAAALITQARQSADSMLGNELSRLEALRSVNPNIREQELTTLARNQQEIGRFLEQAKWRLDALRLIVVSHG